MSDFYFIQEQGTRFHVVYSIPGTNIVSSVADCSSRSGAEQVRDVALKEKAKNDARLAAACVEPQDRKIVPGFYEVD